MTINFDIVNFPTGAPATKTDVRRYFSNLEAGQEPGDALPVDQLPGKYTLDNLTDVVFGGYLRFEFISASNNFLYSNNAPTAGTVTTLNVYSGDKVGNVIQNEVLFAVITPVNWDAVALFNAVDQGNIAAFDAIFYGQDSFNFSGDGTVDTFTGSIFADTLNGEGGNDNIAGDGGDDLFIGGAGNDTMDGGTNDGQGDTVDYSNITNPTQAVIITLGAANVNATNTSTAGSDAAGDLIKNVENLIGGAGNDKLTGNIFNNKLEGRDGDDLLTGGAGDDYLIGGKNNDTLIGGAGNDRLDGTEGDDTVNYSASALAITIDLSLNDNNVVDNSGAQKGGDAEGDKLSQIDIVIGSAKNDIIKGSGLNETFIGGAGADTLDGISGNDTVSFAGATAAVTVNLVAGTGLGGDAAGDTYANFDNIIGGKGNDVLTGNANPSNFIYGGDGNDTIEGGDGSDDLVGGLGIDTLSYASSAVAVQANLTQQGTSLANGEKDTFGTAQTGGDAAGDFIWGFENIIGSAHGDYLIGSTAVNNIQGGAGDDAVLGAQGNDVLDGGAGTYDIADFGYLGSGKNITVTLGALDIAGNVAQTSTSGVAGDVDTIKNFEAIWGGGGNDKLTGNAGANELFGGDGNDFLVGGAGADTLNGGADSDTASYAASTAGVTASLATGTGTNGDAQGDTFTDIERVIGSAFSDRLIANQASNTTEFLDGGAGDDVILANKFGQILLGGAGTADTLSFEGVTSSRSINMTAQGTANGTRTGVTGGANNIGEIVVGYSAAEFENIIGGSDADNIVGNSSANVIEGGGGADELVGGLGVDTVSYAGSSNVFVDLNLQGTSNADGSKNGAATAQSGGTGNSNGDLLWGFENIIGTGTADTLIGDAKANALFGGGGADDFIGGGGNDALDGGTGLDRVIYDYLLSTQHLVLTLGAVDLAGNVAQTSTSGVAGDVDTVKNIEDVGGGKGNDKITGNSIANSLSGGEGNDTLIGLGGADYLVGDAGNDILIGGEGADIIHGKAPAPTFDDGDGGDTIDYTASNAGVSITLSRNTYAIGKGGHAEGDKIAGINGIIGSNFNDILSGELGDDVVGVTLSGGAGDDIIRSAFNTTNSLDGGTNTAAGDTLDYSWLSAASSLSVTLSAVNNAVVLASVSTAVGSANVKNFENVIGGAGNDTITGSTAVNTLEGGKGADTLTAVGAGDTVSYAGSSSQVYVDLGKQDGVAKQDLNHDFGSGAVANGDAAEDILAGGFSGFIGSAFDDIVQGNKTRADVIFGGKGNDDLSGGEGNFADTLDGGEGNDNLFGGLGADKLIGGLGLDTIAYQTGSETAGVTITLGKDGAQTTGTGGDAAGDIITGVENIFGSDFKHATTGVGDKLTGNNLGNELYGNAGNDTLDGAAGNDTLEGGDDNDTLTGGADGDILDGGAGIDTVNYAASLLGVTVLLSKQGQYFNGKPNDGRETTNDPMTGGDAAGDTLWGIENIVGSKKNDVLTGDFLVNILDGGEGDDLLTSNSGADILVGGLGNDTVTYFTSGGGVTVSLLGQGTYNATTMVLTGGTEQSGGDAVGNKFSSIENLVGSGAADELTGDGNANVIEGGGGADTLIGLAGFDTVSYAGAGAGVIVSLSNSYQGTTNATGTILIGAAGQDGNITGDDAGDLLYGFEAILGSVHADTLTSNQAGSTLMGGKGADKLFGGVGTVDKLYGGDGDDTIKGNGGGDTIDGGADIDTVDFSGNATGVTVAFGKNDTTAATVSGGASGHTILAVENAIGTSLADKLTGNDFANQLSGGGNSDILIGLAGDDFLEGSTGNDTLAGGAGEDELSGGDGTLDAVDYSASLQGVTVDLSKQGTYSSGDIRDTTPVGQTGGDAAGDQLWGIEKVIGSGKNDIIEGSDDVSATIDGGNGDDLIIGASAGETLVGGGNTAVVPGSAAFGDTLSYIRSTAGVDVNLLEQGTYNATTGVFTGGITQTGGDAEGDQIAGFENLIGSTHADTLTGDSNANVIEGEDAGDTLFGGGGSDTVSYKNSVFQVTVDLTKQGTTNANGSINVTATKQGGGGHALDDELYGFENIIGTDRPDVGDNLTGDNNANIIDGGAGGDTIMGNGGVDILRGGAGLDKFYAGGTGGAGADTYDGGTEFDAVDYAGETAGVTVVLGANGASANVTGGAGASGDRLISIERLIGGNGADKFTGNNLTHTFEGADGNDVLTGGTGDSSLFGGNGDDTIFASTGDDELYDGGGNTAVGDTLSFANFGAATSVVVNLATDTHGATGITGSLLIADFETVIGGAGNDTLTGYATTATKLQGGSGADTIQGGTAVDTFTGGAGNDNFVFENSGGGKDVFTDFTNGDKLVITSSGFGGGLPLTGSLPDTTWLVVGAAPVTNAGHGQFLYNTTNDTLYWDVDGSGINDSPIEIGQFGSSVVLKLADFTLV